MTIKKPLLLATLLIGIGFGNNIHAGGFVGSLGNKIQDCLNADGLTLALDGNTPTVTLGSDTTTLEDSTGICNSVASCGSLFTCQYKASDFSGVGYTRYHWSNWLWGDPTAQTPVNDILCWLLKHKDITCSGGNCSSWVSTQMSNLLTTCYSEPAHQSGALLKADYWNEIKDISAFSTRILGGISVPQAPILLKDSEIATSGIRIDGRTSLSVSTGVKFGGIPFKTPYGEVIVVDGTLDPNGTMNGYSNMALLNRAPGTQAGINQDCGIYVNTTQPVIIQNLSINGFKSGICADSSSTVIINHVRITGAVDGVDTGGILLVRNSEINAGTAAVNITKEGHAVVENSVIGSPGISKGVAIVNSSFSMIPFDDVQNAPNLQITKVSDQLAAGKLLFGKDTGNPKTIQTVILYVKKPSTATFQEWQRLSSGTDFSPIAGGLFLNGFNINTIPSGTIFTALALPFDPGTDNATKVHDLLHAMEGGIVNARTEFAIPASLDSNTILGGDRALVFCGTGNTVSLVAKGTTWEYPVTDTGVQIPITVYKPGDIELTKTATGFHIVADNNSYLVVPVVPKTSEDPDFFQSTSLDLNMPNKLSDVYVKIVDPSDTLPCATGSGLTPNVAFDNSGNATLSVYGNSYSTNIALLPGEVGSIIWGVPPLPALALSNSFSALASIIQDAQQQQQQPPDQPKQPQGGGNPPQTPPTPPPTGKLPGPSPKTPTSPSPKCTTADCGINGSIPPAQATPVDGGGSCSLIR